MNDECRSSSSRYTINILMLAAAAAALSVLGWRSGGIWGKERSMAETKKQGAKKLDQFIFLRSGWRETAKTS